ncbi:MAG: putative integron cassette protein [Pedosphaera sp.]|nr:putative integron cassette protein [Pedosphaera sp.]
MDKPIVVSFRWSAKEMLLAQRLHMRYSKQGRKLRRIFIGFTVMFTLIGIVGLVRHQDFLTSAFPFFLFAAFFLAMPLFTRRAVLKMYAQKPDRDMLITYEISTGHLISRSEVASTDVLWRTIIRAHRVPEGFLLYPTDRIFHWLPVHGFHDASDVERLAQITKLNVPQYDHAA